MIAGSASASPSAFTNGSALSATFSSRAAAVGSFPSSTRVCDASLEIGLDQCPAARRQPSSTLASSSVNLNGITIVVPPTTCSNSTSSYAHAVRPDADVVTLRCCFIGRFARSAIPGVKRRHQRPSDLLTSPSLPIGGIGEDVRIVGDHCLESGQVAGPRRSV